MLATKQSQSENAVKTQNNAPFFPGHLVQPKLEVNEPGDQYEQEADAMADKVMRMPAGESAFFKPAQATVQRKCQHCEDEEKLHRKESSDTKVQGSHELDNYVGALGSSGQTLPESSRQFFEPRFGRDFSNVRIHTDTVAAKSAQSINALAYTTGNNIVFNSGQYAPESDNGKKLIAHELTHVAQQGEAKSNGQVQRVSIATRGTVAHSGTVGVAAGQQGPPVGSVEVRTGEEIELAPGSRIPNVIAIEYSGSLLADSKWLQFVWFEMLAITPSGVVRASGTIPTSSGSKPFTTNPASPSWTVDSASTSNPFYEAAGVNIRNGSSTTMFDAPGGSSAAPLAAAVYGGAPTATSVIFTAHFDTFLIQNNRAVYHVPYSASTSFAPPAGAASPAASAIGYTVGAAGQLSGLTANLRTILLASYPTFTAIT